ncbi:MAG: hypothetical protein LBL93_06955 [Ruminococcus sp.]|jgi:hypothetical protein|nr:hypothetical protein [Ruminococcus sp.]
MTDIQFENFKRDIVGKDPLQTAETFNNLSIEDKKDYLSKLEKESPVDYYNFIDRISEGAKNIFWNNERRLLLEEGKSTRNWTIEQIEEIMNINPKTGMMMKNAGRPSQSFDDSGKPVRDGKGNYTYYGHFMMSSLYNPWYSGEYRNIQALTFLEYVKAINYFVHGDKG